MDSQKDSQSIDYIHTSTPRPRPSSLNAAMSKDMYKNLVAPKPRRTYSTGLSGILGLVTEHLKQSPPPSLRQSSPQVGNAALVHPAKHAATIFYASNRSSSASISEDQSDLYSYGTVNVGANGTPTTETNTSVLAEFCAAPFLGERKSESGDLNLLFAGTAAHRRGGDGEFNVTISKSVRRSLSLHGLSSRAALVPCMIAMPAGRPYHDLSDALESIPRNSWILPYVIACTPPEILGQLLNLPFLLDGQSNTHTTATTITRSRAQTISFDIDQQDVENTTFTVPLQMKGLSLEESEEAPRQRTSSLDRDDWGHLHAPFLVPLQGAKDRECNESPVDDLPVTRARGHTHTGSAYEPDPSLFTPYLPAARSSSQSYSRGKDLVPQVRMSASSPRAGAGLVRANSLQASPKAAINQTKSSFTHREVTPPPPLTVLLDPIPESVIAEPPAEVDPFKVNKSLPMHKPVPINTTLTSGNMVPPSRTPSPSVSSAALGLIPQTVNFPSSWRSLGIVWLSADPKWNVWHPKIVFLLDNYLLECTAVGTGVIGYTQLSGATIEKKIFHYSTRKGFPPKQRSPVVESSGSPDGDYFNVVAIEDGFDPDDGDDFEKEVPAQKIPSPLRHTGLPSYGLKITCFTTSALGAPAKPAAAGAFATNPKISTNKSTGPAGTHSYWLTTHDEAALDYIAAALQRASTLTFEDVFEVQRLTQDDSLLGQGRFNEVRLARRREDVDFFKNTSVFTSPQTKSRSTSNAPEYVPFEKATSTVNFDTSKLMSEPWQVRKAAVGTTATASASVKADVAPGRQRSGDSGPLGSESSVGSQEEFSPAHEYFASSGKSGTQIDGSFRHSEMESIDVHLAGSVSSQGPLFALLSPSMSNDLLSYSNHSIAAAAGATSAPPRDPFALDPFCVSSHSHNRSITAADNDRMSDDVISPPPRQNAFSFAKPAQSNPFQNSSAAAEVIATCQDILNDSAHDGEIVDDSRFRGEELLHCCAMKLVAKEMFWNRVDDGCERGDALVREVLAQMLVASHFADHPGLAFKSVLGVQPYLSSADSSSSKVHEGIAAAMQSYNPFRIARSMVQKAGFNAFSTSSAPEAPTQPHLPVVQLFSAFETADGFAMELELMQSMDLFDLLAEVGTLPERHVQSIVAQLIEAVSLCNKLGIAHRDIKLSNVCFSLHQCKGKSIQSLLQGQECIRVKLADFGMTGFLARDKRLRGRCGTPGYVAPDILNADKNGNYGLNVDTFSIGVVAYTLLCGYEPFYGTDNKDLLRANKCAEYKFHSPEWDNVSADAKDWISKTLLLTAEKRISPEGARKHPWLRSFFGKNGGSINNSVNNVNTQMKEGVVEALGTDYSDNDIYLKSCTIC